MIQKDIFSRLKRLFSTDVIIRNVGGNQLRVIDTDRIQSAGNVRTNSLIDRFTRIHRSTQSSAYYPSLNYQTLRIQLYSDYEAMDTDAIIASALDIIADECTLRNESNEVLQIRSSDENIQKILYNLFYDILNIEFNLWTWIRNMCKYGDFYLYLEIAEKLGIYNVKPLSSYDIVREEGTDPKNSSYVSYKFDTTINSNIKANPLFQGREKFENYEIGHFRLLADANYLPYGRSFIEPARKIWKQLTLMEDAMLVHRIMRAPEKRTFYVNVGNIPPNEVDAYMQKIMQTMKKTPFMDQTSGEYNLKYNIQNILEDFYIPVRGTNDGARIETTKGLEYNAIEDVEYLRDKMMAALKVPKAFMGYEKDLCISAETLIPLLDGRTLKVKEIIEEYNNGKKNYVYSLNECNKNIVPGEIEWAGYTRMNTKTIKVWLDNNEFIQCTPDHLFLTRDGKWIEAQYLKENDSLMPLYLQKSKNKLIPNYTEVYNPSTEKYEFVHRLVANYYNIKKEGKVIHHKDCNKLNNNPENLDGSMDFWEHRKWHTEHNQLCHTPEAREKRKNTWNKMMEDPNFAKKRKEFGKNNVINLLNWIKENGSSRKNKGKTYKYFCEGCENLIEFKRIAELNNHKNEYCSKECMRLNWKCKSKNVSLEELLNNAKESKSFKELKNKLNIKDHSTLNKLILNYGYTNVEFILKEMPLAHYNRQVMNQFPKTHEYYINNINPNIKEGYKKIKNHKVTKIEWIEEKIDTCDLTIKNYHNFGTNAGVIIHNSGKATLAAEDIRFARTVERIQRIVVSELTKLALIHLYTQGYQDESMTNFELQLTTPSIVYEQERTALWKEKIGLAQDMLNTKMLPTDWIYDKIFQFSEDQLDDLRDLVIEDKNREFRLQQLENEGNDPMKTGRTYGTKHDIAELTAKAHILDSMKQNIPKGYNENEPQKLGRPKEKASTYNTQQSNMGRDLTGRKEAFRDPKPNPNHPDFKGGSPLSLNYETLIRSIPTKYIKDINKNKPTLLSEDNIRDIK